MNRLPAIASTALPLNILLSTSHVDPSLAHRQRSPITSSSITINRLRGAPTIAKPTFHPTYPDWSNRYDTFDTDYPTNFPTYSSNDDDDDNDDHTEIEHDDSTRQHAILKPTLHPTYPDWDSIYEQSNNYPTTYPTYDVFPTDMPTRLDWDLYDVPTLSPTALDEAERSHCESGRFFQLDIATAAEGGCETSWELVKLPNAVVYQGDGYKDGFVYEDVAKGCLEPGEYEFTIYDAGGDGIKRQGYYLLKLDGKAIAGGNDFGYKDTTRFAIDPDGKPATPNMAPVSHSSMTPSIVASSVSPSIAPSIESSITPSMAPSDDQLEISIRHIHDNWVQIIDDNFDNGFGSFVDGGSNVIHYAAFKDRSGVIAVQGAEGSETSLVTKRIRLGESIGDGHIHSNFKVVFSHYSYGMKSKDGYCMDYSVDNGLNWHAEKCWNTDVDFHNDIWYDDVEVVFEPQVVDTLTLRIRLHTSSKDGSFLLDSIQLYDLHD
ncbi:hypothetical protein HJC23_005741 [Cyclotella cryptica]|uniref:Uncharacterized protein n=1 Tax=Cyclotella cryptica TaxID=29204 RepID=A0ABD3QKB4_9STRA|eukprot:CCRYP_006499-RA/>CCRYP_006499-RA protein AED:0.00 eAED:0.00 QI:40/1/1/1/1/1/2/111/488